MPEHFPQRIHLRGLTPLMRSTCSRSRSFFVSIFRIIPFFGIRAALTQTAKAAKRRSYAPYSSAAVAFTPSASASSSVKYTTGRGLPFFSRLYRHRGQAVTIR